MKRLIAVTAALGLGVAGLATAGSASAGTTTSSKAATAATTQAVPVTPSSINWTTCDDPGLTAFGAVCGTLKVPLDYSKPNGAKVTLFMSMVRHTVPDSKYQGIMLVNPGGPGGSGAGLSFLGQLIPNHAGDAYDWIGWDPRGVGQSTPALTCDPNILKGPRPEYVPYNISIQDAWLARSKAYAQKCAQAGGALLDHLTTPDSAKDMDSIRKAMGQQQLNYYGFSYGTYLAQVYGTLFPSHVRRMVLDSNVDPRDVWYQANLAQDPAFDRNTKIWFRWVAKYDSVYHLGATESAVEHLFYDVQNQLQANPAGGEVGADEWADAFQYGGYYQFEWTTIAQVFSDWVHNHDVAELVDWYRGVDGVGDDNGYAMYLATECTDAPWPGVSKYISDNWRVFQKAPYFTWLNAWFNGPCLFWKGQVHHPVSINGSKVKSVLLVDETLDAATPYEGSLEVRKLFPHSSLIAVAGGTTHANTLAGNGCVDNRIATYLLTGKLPPRKAGNGPDVTCQALPKPVPDGATANAQSQAQAQAKVAPGATGTSDLRRRLQEALVRQ
jgi:pimeloyl-ACP methyl ester carboxylesterase